MIYGAIFIALLIIITSINKTYKPMKKEITQEEKDIILELISNAAICEPDHITEETRLEEDLTLDSLDQVQLFYNIEREFNICISDSDIEKCKTVSQVFNLVAERI